MVLKDEWTIYSKFSFSLWAYFATIKRISIDSMVFKYERTIFDSKVSFSLWANFPYLLYLRTLSKDVVKSYMDELRRVRCWFSYPPNQFDVRSTLNVVCPSDMNMFTAMLQLFIRRKRSHPTSNEVADGVAVQ